MRDWFSGRGGTFRGDVGESLVEMLVAIAIVGIAMVGMVPAVASSLSTADRVQKHARVGEVMSSAVSAIQATAWRADCNYSAALSAVSAAPNATVAQSFISHWDGTTFGAGCPAPGDPAAFKSVRLRLTVSTPDGRSSQWVEVVKRP